MSNQEKNEVRTQELEKIAQRLREGLPEELVQGEGANIALRRAARLVMEGVHTEEELVSKIKDSLGKRRERRRQDIQGLIDSQELVETQLKGFARCAFAGEEIAEDINKLESQFPPLRFLKVVVMSEDKEKINAQRLKEEGVPDEYTPLFIRWRNQYDILNNPFRRAIGLEHNRKNSCDYISRTLLYNSQRDIPQAEVRLYAQGKQVFYTRDDVDDIFWLASVFLDIGEEALRDNVERRIDSRCIERIRKTIKTIEPMLEDIKENLKVFEERERSKAR